MPPAKKPARRQINLDKARAARREAAREPVVLTFGGKDHELPVELPVDYALCAQEGNLRGAINALLGDSAATFVADATMDDLTSLIEMVNQEYGVAQGEVPASPST